MKINFFSFRFLLITLTVLVLGRYLLLPDCPLKRVNSSFLQLYNYQRSFSVNDWESLFQQTRSMGIRHLIIQWSAYDNSLFYATAKPYDQSLLFKVISAAGKAHLTLTMGLNYDSPYWSALAENDNQLRRYLDERFQQQSKLLADLLTTINSADPEGNTVIGWYLSDEIDDQSWHSPNRLTILKTYLQQMALLLQKEKPGWPISISTFSTGQASKTTITELYNFLFGIPSLNRIMFQDSIGTQKLNLATLESYLQTIAPLFADNKQRLGVISELFITNEKTKTITAAPATRVMKQLHLARKYTETDLVLFSFFNYVLPIDKTSDSATLYQFWHAQLKRCKGL